MFPVLTSAFLRELFDSRLQDTVLIRPMSYENIQQHGAMFQQLQQAILHQQTIGFDYRKKDSTKRVTVQPYKLVHQHGVWYLAAVDGEVLKTYTVSRIGHLVVLSEQLFERHHAFEAQLEQDDSIWLNTQKQSVTLKVSPYAANYFRQKQLISAQTIEQELDDGSLLVSGKFAHPNQILPIVRSWIPDIHIISPIALQQMMENELLDYLNRKKK
jgi:predicted DNA-binding transcriptional regulator YafY